MGKNHSLLKSKVTSLSCFGQTLKYLVDQRQKETYPHIREYERDTKCFIKIIADLYF